MIKSALSRTHRTCWYPFLPDHILVDSSLLTFPANQQSLKLLRLNSPPTHTHTLFIPPFPALSNLTSLPAGPPPPLPLQGQAQLPPSLPVKVKIGSFSVSARSSCGRTTRAAKRGAWKISFPHSDEFLSALKKKQGFRPCCNLFTPKAKGELKRVTLVSEPMWEGLQFAHQHSCCWAVRNDAPEILSAETRSTVLVISSINRGSHILCSACQRRMLLLSSSAHASCNLLNCGYYFEWIVWGFFQYSTKWLKHPKSHLCLLRWRMWHDELVYMPISFASFWICFSKVIITHLYDEYGSIWYIHTS